MASAAFHFAAQASGLKYAGTAGGTVVATLDSANGVDYANWTIEGKDETSAADWSLSASTGNSITVTLPASGTGKAMILRCTVNGDPDLTATAKVYIAPEVGAVGEQSESDADYGQAAFINPPIRAIGGVGSVSSAATPSTIMSRDGSSNTAVNRLTANEVVAGTALVLQSGGGSYVAVYEDATEVLRINDVGGRRTVQLQGTGDFSSTGSLRLGSAGGTSLYEDGVEVCTAQEAAGVASLTFPAATAGRVAATTASAAFRVACGAGGTVQILEGTTDVAHFDDDAGVSRISGRGASGTRLEANASNLTLRSASAAYVSIQEGTTEVCRVFDNGGSPELACQGNGRLTSTGTLSMIATSYANIQGPSQIYYDTASHVFRSAAGANWALINGVGALTLPVIAAGSVVSPAAGSKTLFFDASNSDKLSSKSSGGTVTVIGTES